MAAGGGFDRPIFIVSPPRSGSSLLFQTLARAPGVATIGGESHQLIEGIPGLHPYARGWPSNVLGAADATPAVADALTERLRAAMRTRDGRADARARLLEKTPKNALRIPFLDAIFPDARFVFLYRDPRETMASMMEAWESGRFVTYPRLPDWPGLAWSLLLVPGWRDLAGRPLAEVVARQWAATMRILLVDLASIDRSRIVGVDHADVVAAPGETMPRLAAALGLGWDVALGEALPLSPTVVSAPAADKWRGRADALTGVLPIVAETDAAARALLETVRI